MVKEALHFLIRTNVRWKEVAIHFFCKNQISRCTAGGYQLREREREGT